MHSCVAGNGPVDAEDPPLVCQTCNTARLFDHNGEPINTVARFSVSDWLQHLLRYPNMDKYMDTALQQENFYGFVTSKLADGDDLIAG